MARFLDMPRITTLIAAWDTLTITAFKSYGYIGRALEISTGFDCVMPWSEVQRLRRSRKQRNRRFTVTVYAASPCASAALRDLWTYSALLMQRVRFAICECERFALKVYVVLAQPPAREP